MNNCDENAPLSGWKVLVERDSTASKLVNSKSSDEECYEIIIANSYRVLLVGQIPSTLHV